jgi:hypothetical protein
MFPHISFLIAIFPVRWLWLAMKFSDSAKEELN